MSDRQIKIEDVLKSLPEKLLEFAGPENPTEQKLMAAQGFVPLDPKDMAMVLFCLTFDKDENIKTEAENSLRDMPENAMKDILRDHSTIPDFIDYVARKFDNESYVEFILLNSNTLDSTYAYLARTHQSESNIDIIANNRQRILRSEAIVEALSDNAAVRVSVLDNVLSYISHYVEKSQSATNSAQKPQIQESRDDINLNEIEEQESFLDAVEFSTQLVDESKEEDLDDSAKKGFALQVQSLTVAAKVKLALVGNIEARRTLIRSSNRVISLGVVKNPRLTDAEVATIAQSRVVDENVLKEVAKNKKWTKNYSVKSYLVNNPKTPVSISLNLLSQLNSFDIKKIGSSKHLPGTIVQTAKRLTDSRKR